MTKKLTAEKVREKRLLLIMRINQAEAKIRNCKQDLRQLQRRCQHVNRESWDDDNCHVMAIKTRCNDCGLEKDGDL